MSLNVHVEAEPESMHQLAHYFGQIAERANIARGEAMSARTESSPWEGDAGEGFRAIAYRMHDGGDKLMDAYQSGADALRKHANDIAVVRDRMDDACGVARKAGLAVTEREIHDPGPAPTEPEPLLPSDFGDDADAKRASLDAYTRWTDKAAAYAQCVTMVAEARTIEHESQNKALEAVGAITDKPIVTGSNLLTGLASGYLAQQQTWRTVASSFTGIAKNASQAAKDATLGAGSQAKNLVTSMIAEAKAGVADAKANTSKIGRLLEKLPTRAQNAITWKLERIYPKNRPFLAKAPAVFKNVSGLGGIFTGVSVAIDVADGKNATKSIVTNGSGLLAGTAAGAVIGGPPGAVVGFIVGTGTSMATNEVLNPDTKEHIIAPGAEHHPHRLNEPSDPRPN